MQCSLYNNVRNARVSYAQTSRAFLARRKLHPSSVYQRQIRAALWKSFSWLVAIIYRVKVKRKVQDRHIPLSYSTALVECLSWSDLHEELCNNDRDTRFSSVLLSTRIMISKEYVSNIHDLLMSRHSLFQGRYV